MSIFAVAWLASACLLPPAQAAPSHALGVVSNVFADVKAHTASLQDVLARALQEGYTYVELRQGSLSTPYEDGTGVPDSASIVALARQFPTLEFNYAFQLPFSHHPTLANTCNSTMFNKAVETASLLKAAGKRALLRIVDVATGQALWNSTTEAADQFRAAVACMAAAARDAGLEFAVENAKIQWATWRAAIGAVAGVRTCFDPCNILAFAGEDGAAVADATAAVSAQEVAMLHVKQVSPAGGVSTVVSEGRLDWSAQAAAFNAKNYDGPVLFELTPSSGEYLWDALRNSTRFLQSAGFTFNLAPLPSSSTGANSPSSTGAAPVSSTGGRPAASSSTAPAPASSTGDKPTTRPTAAPVASSSTGDKPTNRPAPASTGNHMSPAPKRAASVLGVVVSVFALAARVVGVPTLY